MRSKYEEKVAAYLKENKVKFEYEPFSVLYWRSVRGGNCAACDSNKVRKAAWYTPDFVLKNEIIIEAKGKFTPSNRTAMLELLDTSDYINRGNYRVLFMRDNPFGKRKTTYTEWCAKHDITAAVSLNGEVPKEWLNLKS